MSKLEENNCLKFVKNALLGRTRNASVRGVFPRKELNLILETSYPNPEESKFPDFFFEGGIIEHFTVTSSKETRKGSSFAIDEKTNEKEDLENYKKDAEEFLKSERHQNTIIVNKHENVYEDFSYEYFFESLKKNFSNHISSLKNSEFIEKYVVFLIEQKTARLWFDEGRVPIRFYEMQLDKKVLMFFKDYSNLVDCIIYCVADYVEVIDLSKIDEMLPYAKDNLKIRGGRLRNRTLNFFIDL